MSKKVQRYIIPVNGMAMMFAMTHDEILAVEYSSRKGRHLSFFAEFAQGAPVLARKFIARRTDEVAGDTEIYRGTALPRTEDGKFWHLYEIPLEWFPSVTQPPKGPRHMHHVLGKYPLPCSQNKAECIRTQRPDEEITGMLWEKT